MKIGVIVERRYLRQTMPAAVLDVFRARGIVADVLSPQHCRFTTEMGMLETESGEQIDLNHYDAMLSRNRSALGLAVLAYADAADIPAINTYRATQQVRNKAEMAIALGRAGVPCAPTILASDVASLASLPQSWFPLILKATYGDNSQGLRLVRGAEDLGDLHWGEELVLAQHYLPNDGFDLKLYVCGRDVFAVRKPSPFNGDPQASPEPVRPDPRMIELALRCGDIFGLDVYGVDTVETTDGPAVIEVNDFPNFTGIPEAADLIADYVLARATGRGACANRVLSR